MFGLDQQTSLLLYALIAVILIVLLIARFKMNSFVALILASLFVGLASGMKLTEIGKVFQEGVGAILGSIAMVIGLGTVLGKMLAESGGAACIAHTLIDKLGMRRIHWAMMLVGLLVGIPVFFAVGLVLLIPIVLTIARHTQTPLLYLAIPLVASLSVMHGLVPPHPGPMVAIELLGADIGKTIVYSLIIGVPTAVIAGPLFGKWVSRRIPVHASGTLAEQLARGPETANPPGFGLTVFTILLPVLLMLAATAADSLLRLDAASPAPALARIRQIALFLGHPVVALLIAVLFSFYSFGFARGFTRTQILNFSNECLGPVAAMLLIVGAGGGFNRILVAGGVGTAIANLVNNLELSPLLLGWIVAALIRIATGSATVAISTAAGIVAPVAALAPETNLELLVLAMGAGSLILSHVNDGGFWFVKEYLNLTVTQTLQTWTVMETIISIVAMVFVLALDRIL